MNNEKQTYQRPIIEINEIDLEASIAASGPNGVSLWEELWG